MTDYDSIWRTQDEIRYQISDQFERIINNLSQETTTFSLQDLSPYRDFSQVKKMQASFTAYLHSVDLSQMIYSKKANNTLFQSFVAVDSRIAQFLLNTDELIVFGHAVGTRKRTSLDLS